MAVEMAVIYDHIVKIEPLITAQSTTDTAVSVLMDDRQRFDISWDAVSADIHGDECFRDCGLTYKPVGPCIGPSPP